MQVFNLAVLPGTAFRQEAQQLGLQFQPRPPYYVTETPTLALHDMLELMDEAQSLFGIEFDPLPPPALEFAKGELPARVARIDLDEINGQRTKCEVPGTMHSQAFTLWLTSVDLHAQRSKAAELVERLLADNPFTTLQVVLEPRGEPRRVTPQLLQRLTRACFQNPTYLDKFYAVLPGPTKGAKRLVVALPLAERARLGDEWIEEIGQYATLAWRGPQPAEAELEPHEYVVAQG
jgi:hypothetical protein